MKKLVLLLGLIMMTGTAYAQNKCYILGDSIAQGVSKYSERCNSSTRVGLNTQDAKNYFTSKGQLYFDSLIISLGINDKGQPEKTWNNLVAIRSNVTAKKVIWILPNSRHPEQNSLVKQMASRYGDSYIDISPVISTDGIHPTPQGYKIIADTLKNYY